MLALSVTGGVELVERNRLEAVRQQQKFGVTGLIDDATAASVSAAGVPPNLAGQPIEAGPTPISAQTESVRQEQPPSSEEPRPVHHPPQMQVTPTHRQPPLHIVFSRCRQITDPRAKKRCLDRLRALILGVPLTPRKVAARRCLKISNPRQRTRCLQEVFGELEREGIKTELFQLAGKKIRGCAACYKCLENKDQRYSTRNDVVNECIEKMIATQGIILGSPTYFADLTAEMKALVDRAGSVARENGDMFKRKVGASASALVRAMLKRTNRVLRS